MENFIDGIMKVLLFIGIMIFGDLLMRFMFEGHIQFTIGTIIIAITEIIIIKYHFSKMNDHIDEKFKEKTGDTQNGSISAKIGDTQNGSISAKIGDTQNGSISAKIDNTKESINSKIGDTNMILKDIKYDLTEKINQAKKVDTSGAELKNTLDAFNEKFITTILENNTLKTENIKLLEENQKLKNQLEKLNIRNQYTDIHPNDDYELER